MQGLPRMRYTDIPRAARSLGHAGPMIYYSLSESSDKINKEGKYITQKLSFGGRRRLLVNLSKASEEQEAVIEPCERNETVRAKKRSKRVTARLLSEGVH